MARTKSKRRATPTRAEAAKTSREPTQRTFRNKAYLRVAGLAQLTTRFRHRLGVLASGLSGRFEFELQLTDRAVCCVLALNQAAVRSLQLGQPCLHRFRCGGFPCFGFCPLLAMYVL